VRFHGPFCESAAYLLDRTKSLTKSTFSSVRHFVHGLPLPVSLLTVPVSLNFFTSLLMPLFVHHLFFLEIHSLTPLLCIPSTYTIFYQNFIFVARNHVYKHCGDVCIEAFLMPQFLEVLRQHVLSVVGNVTYSFVANLTNFAAVK